MRLHAARTPTFSHQPAGPNLLALVTREHDPVLAPELVDLLAPEPGQTAIDCTFGAGGHARLIAERLGPEGTLIGIDRDPTAQERFNRFAAEAPCKALFVGADFVAGLRRCRAKESAQTWSTWIWECPRCRSTPGSGAFPTPMTRRSTCGWTRDRASTPPTSSMSGRRGGSPRCCAASARSATRTASPRRSSAAGRSAPPPNWSPRWGRGCPPRPASAAATRPSAPSRPCGSPSTVSSTC